MKQALVIMLFGILSGCGWAAPGAGEEVVLIEKPWFFGHGGVDPEPIRTGRTLIAWTTEAVTVEMRPTQYEVKFADLMSSDGVPLGFDSVIRLQVTDSVGIIQKFGDNWYKANVEMEFSNRIRQAVRKHGMNETAISTIAIDAIDAEVTQAMDSFIKESGIPIKLVKVTVGKANPPDSIKNQRVETAAQQQRQQTEQQKKLAEDQRKAAEMSRAAADNAYREAMNLSPAQFIQLETINMQREVCASQSTCNFVIGGNVMPALSVKPVEAKP